MIKILRFAVFAAFMFCAVQFAVAEEIELPKNYATCKKDAPYTTITEQKCIYLVPEDKGNGQATKDFLACRLSNPNYEYLKKFTCQYEASDDLTRMTALRCTRHRMPDVLPPIEDDCKFVFYNPDYVFPTNFAECMAKEDRKEDVTAELKKICSLVITYNPAIAGEFFFDDEEASALVEKCQVAGGQGSVVANAFPECTLTFTEP